jgi:hypothetical protein
MCVEVSFRKSTHSTVDECVEVGACRCGVKVRDSKDPDGPVLDFGAAAWSEFLAGVRSGEFDPA